MFKSIKVLFNAAGLERSPRILLSFIHGKEEEEENIVYWLDVCGGHLSY